VLGLAVSHQQLAQVIVVGNAARRDAKPRDGHHGIIQRDGARDCPLGIAAPRLERRVALRPRALLEEERLAPLREHRVSALAARALAGRARLLLYRSLTRGVNEEV